MPNAPFQILNFYFQGLTILRNSGLTNKIRLKHNNDKMTLEKANKYKSCPRVITKNILHDYCSIHVLFTRLISEFLAIADIAIN